MPKAYAEDTLTFTPALPAAKIVLKSKKQPLDAACDAHAPGDNRCACVMNEVFKHDSSWMTAGVGRWANNPCNMRVPATWKPTVPLKPTRMTPNGIFSQFETKEDGIVACVQLYARKYADKTPEDLVSIWTDGGGQGAYLENVKKCY